MKHNKWMALLLAAAMGAACCAGCTAENEPVQAEPDYTQEEPQMSAAQEADSEKMETESVLTAGRYTATVKGFLGDITVEMETSDSEILSIEIGEHKESRGFGAEALPMLVEEILEKQTAEVDVVTSATISSASFLAAVRDCLRQANADESFFQQEEKGEKEEISLQVDVLVVGSGAAGCAAAVTAREEGADTLLIEKLDIPGGTTKSSSGAIMAAGSQLNRDSYQDPEALVKHWQYFAEGFADENVLRVAANASGANVDWLIDDVGMVLSLSASPGEDCGGAMWTHATEGWSGWTFIDKLLSKYESIGGKLMLGTKATELLTDEEGKVIGAVAQSDDAVYTIKAEKGVILATGGFDNNSEMMEKYAPKSAHCINAGANAGDTGEGILMAMAVGADSAFSGYGLDSVPVCDVDEYTDYVDRTVSNRLDDETHRLEVCGSGTRLCSEEKPEGPTGYLDLGGIEKLAMLRSGEKNFYLIFDSQISAEAKEIIEYAVSCDVAWKAESLEELAELAGIEQEPFLDTVVRFNEMAAKGTDEDFGNSRIGEADITVGPFYAVKNNMCILGSSGGLKVNEKAQVLDVQGSAIAGLYAAGECAGANFYYRNYISGGTSLCMGVALGRLAAQNAVDR